MPSENGQETKIGERLSASSNDFAEHFEDQRRDYGQAHRLKNEICVSSKEGIKMLGKGLRVEAENKFMICQQAFDELCQSNIPTDQAWKLQNDAGQELVEFIFVLNFYHALINELEINEIKIPDPQKYKVSPQSWLAGIADAAGEMLKLIVSLAYHEVADEATLYDKGIVIAGQLEDYLYKFARTYPMVLNNNRYRGQGFGKKLRQLNMSLLRAMDKVLDRRSQPQNS